MSNVSLLRKLIFLKGSGTLVPGTVVLTGDAMAEMFVANTSSERWFPDDRYVTAYGGSSAGDKTYFNGIFKENTQYVLSFTMYKASSTGTNIAVYYTDGTSEFLPSVETGVKQRKTLTTAAGKTVDYIGGKKQNNYLTRIYVDESKIYEKS